MISKILAVTLLSAGLSTSVYATASPQESQQENPEKTENVEQSEKADSVAATSETACDSLYCTEKARAKDDSVSEAAKLFRGSSKSYTFYHPLTPTGTASGLPCEGKGCTLTTPNGSGAYKFREHDTILNTVLGGTVGALAGNQAFGDAGAIGFGITGAIWGNKQSTDYKPAKYERWEKQIQAREDVLNNFRDMVFDPAHPIPVDAHYLGGRRKKKK
ncbi:hypothetical protein [Kordiimonas sp. SCSIO 12610]|uniref:hypothetical protein n=1 Tax=Kordiimonas sp. SCSIO 12610 TaxID=2829597 RepID=UPI00210CEE6C|nr:hypothetical protein [Kordiimonas sp. SCSIO 12610]UTW56650.1 hypothetical protein KFF44_07095 [Kordiimonas sp. SCSIO 12610]